MTGPAPWIPAEAGGAERRHAPATLRNRMAIADVLREVLPRSGTVLEIASGSGEHAAYFAGEFPALAWQPSDPDGAALTSIASWCEGIENVLPPLDLDAAAPAWPVSGADAVLCVNMVHISPWEATLGLMAGAGRVLVSGAPLILYGPFLRDDVPTAASNLAFDESLRARDPAWGIRSIAAVAAAGTGFTLERAIEMPANNLMLVFRRR
ncbi:DUF938 domain-containing protein [Sphingomonas sp. HMP6]|uniref:DUF938 domain-containing protein n=1 Tax=Sphingomonas sp. HMP6 TaxID=1517551 RepID=UPI0015983D36|nr:DUF938 domain-containing protein [Sphingomonas sp. HMP6]BCA57435.1 SAM-dependent methyltransferase [Sphingomonas sp. HMP6]